MFERSVRTGEERGIGLGLHLKVAETDADQPEELCWRHVDPIALGQCHGLQHGELLVAGQPYNYIEVPELTVMRQV